jgi:broad specificity phosphatase PhoE
MIRVILVRHGRTESGPRPRFRGRLDLALSPPGLEQARAAGKRIRAAWQPSAVYTSPLRRCLETGQIIAQSFGLDARPVDGLIDIDYGEWQGLTLDQVRTRWRLEFETWSRMPHRATIPDGESLPALASRVTAALRELLERHPGETVVVVGHGSVNRVILLHALRIPLSRYRCLGQDMGAVNELNFYGGHIQVRSMNERCQTNPLSQPATDGISAGQPAPSE